MYGLVNRAIEDMTRQVGGDALWDRVRAAAELQEQTFLAMSPYPDDMTYALVAAASEVMETPVDTLLRAFGRHWITYTGREGYGALLTMGGATLPQFLRNLDAMHSRIAVAMPELRPPSFLVTELDASTIRVSYHSHRAGLAPMVVGLLEGLGEMFGSPVEVTTVHLREPGQDCDEFLVVHG